MSDDVTEYLKAFELLESSEADVEKIVLKMVATTRKLERGNWKKFRTETCSSNGSYALTDDLFREEGWPFGEQFQAALTKYHQALQLALDLHRKIPDHLSKNLPKPKDPFENH